ncbi:MAG: cyanophycin synthetase [Isosphaeraceae bacterium]|nr:cyanophycin synthetase [Isosphaeraceae bacterium]
MQGVIFRKVLALRGPNIWANSPVLEAWVDLQDLKDSPSNTLPGFNERLKSWLPSLVEHECSEGHRGGFFVRLDEGTWPGHILEHVALELQTLAGTPVGFGRTRETAEAGVYKVAIKYKEEALARACLESARLLLLAAIHDTPYDTPGEIKRLQKLAYDVCLGPTAAIVDAAKARGIPTRRLNNEGLDESLVQLGHGVKQRRILSAYTDRTAAISESISQDKELTKVLLRCAGIPVPQGRPVEDAEDAWEAARELGVPIVVKPRDADYGHGVGLNLTTREQIHAAYLSARDKSEHVIAERQANGWEHRLLVVAGKLVAAVRREPPQVVGDGIANVAQLVEAANNDPRRGSDHTTIIKKIKVDEAALACLESQGLTLESVPAPGQVVRVRRNTHLWDGGTTTDVTDIVHPEVAARAVEATRVVNLDVAGLDIIAEDISRPLEEQGGVILEINAAPSLKMHLEPTVGSARPVGEAIIDSMFPEGEDGRIPIVAVTGVNGKTTTTRLVAHILRQTGVHLGMTCTDGIYVDGRRIEIGDCSGPKSARMVLLNPKVEAAVFEVARGGILREGLGFDRCHVAVVTNIGEGDHLGLGDVHTLEKLALVKRTPVDVVLPEGTAVLNASDPLVAAMAPKCRGAVTFFALDETCPALAEHRAEGKRVAFVRDNAVVLAEGDQEVVLADLGDVPLTLGGRVRFQVENVLAASAAAWALKVPFEIIRQALASFTSDMRQVPGRFNILHVRGATVVVDFGHNPSALVALTESLLQFPHERRSVVFSADGDRSDDAILRQAEILGNTIDRVILYEEECRNRGRKPGEIFALLKRGLALGSCTSEVIDADGELGAIRLALDTVQPGDLLLVLHDAVESSLAFIQNYLAIQAPRRDPRESESTSGQQGRGLLTTPAVSGEPS